MNRGARLVDPGWPIRLALALILACLGLAVWPVAGLALTLVCLGPLALLLTLSLPLAVVLPPLAIACRSRSGWRWGWLCGPWWPPALWLCRAWLRWPWLCWSWLR
jgi:hypothetical protein